MSKIGAGVAASILMTILATAAPDSGVPKVQISNKLVTATVLLPDPQRGYYRGSRFDWAGAIEDLEFAGHHYFGKWFEGYDPFHHDSIMGPVEEFRSEDGAIGYNEAKPGGLFLKIGVGVLRKPDDRPYSFARPYQIAIPGHRIVRPSKDKIDFVHELSDGEGYTYVYRKTVRLVPGKPELVLEHSLRNLGKRAIDTNVYNHDFFVIDSQPTGPDFIVKFNFKPKPLPDFKGPIEIKDKTFTFTEKLEPKHSAGGYVEGYGPTAADNDFRVENAKTGAGVREVGDRPLSKLYFWSVPTTVCPEAYVKIHIEPGQQFKWRISYRFYTLESEQRAGAKKKSS